MGGHRSQGFLPLGLDGAKKGSRSLSQQGEPLRAEQAVCGADGSWTRVKGRGSWRPGLCLTPSATYSSSRAGGLGAREGPEVSPGWEMLGGSCSRGPDRPSQRSGQFQCTSISTHVTVGSPHAAS